LSFFLQWLALGRASPSRFVAPSFCIKGQPKAFSNLAVFFFNISKLLTQNVKNNSGLGKKTRLNSNLVMMLVIQTH